jgi:hypothetical protein
MGVLGVCGGGEVGRAGRFLQGSGPSCDVSARKPHRPPDNAGMTAFYWVMGILIVGTLAPSVMYILLYAATGEPACLSRARTLWNVSRVVALFGTNVLIWGHVVVGLWRIWF